LVRRVVRVDPRDMSTMSLDTIFGIALVIEALALLALVALMR
jgi:hypothetical protein